MNDFLIEIVFKDIRSDLIRFLLKDLSFSGEKIVGYNVTCDCPEVNWDSDTSIESMFLNNENFGIFLNLKELVRCNICLPNCGIAVYKNENAINLEINFQLLDLPDRVIQEMPKNLMELAKSVALQYHIDNYFCGIEPAQELTTRFFTKEQIGPFRLDRGFK